MGLSGEVGFHCPVGGFRHTGAVARSAVGWDAAPTEVDELCEDKMKNKEVAWSLYDTSNFCYMVIILVLITRRYHATETFLSYSS